MRLAFLLTSAAGILENNHPAALIGRGVKKAGGRRRRSEAAN